jgi:plasmid stabilization system protein ParE
LSNVYFHDLHEATQELAEHPNRFQSREELDGGTGIKLHAVRQHILAYERVNAHTVAIVAVLRQDRDIPNILRKGAYMISRELKALRDRGE